MEKKLEESDIKILRRRYRNETRSLEILMEKEIKFKTKTKKEDKIEEYRTIIDMVISEVEDLKVRAIDKLNKMKKIRTKTDELEKEKALACISMTERLYGY